ncbi:MAG TPA: PH domain-containing protein [Candidatus Sulfotelmatobacter sp.]|nr:PH domain-containing protein [Candidatus Sulfotelmatobacter sp.]
MAIFSQRRKPPWLDQARRVCRSSGITIMGWGPELLTVEAKSPQRVEQIALQLAPLGFQPIRNDDNASAGMLDLSPNPEAVRSKIASFDISRRPFSEQVEPLVWALGMLLLVPGFDRTPGHYWLHFPLGLAAAVLFVWDVGRIWGWRVELLPEGLRVRRRFRWTLMPWDQIQSVDSRDAGRSQEGVVLKLRSHDSVDLGKFFVAFARNLRDRLRYELAQRTPRGS